MGSPMRAARSLLEDTAFSVIALAEDGYDRSCFFEGKASSCASSSVIFSFALLRGGMMNGIVRIAREEEYGGMKTGNERFGAEGGIYNIERR